MINKKNDFSLICWKIFAPNFFSIFSLNKCWNVRTEQIFRCLQKTSIHSVTVRLGSVIITWLAVCDRSMWVLKIDRTLSLKVRVNIPFVWWTSTNIILSINTCWISHRWACECLTYVIHCVMSDGCHLTHSISRKMIKSLLMRETKRILMIERKKAKLGADTPKNGHHHLRHHYNNNKNK